MQCFILVRCNVAQDTLCDALYYCNIPLPCVFYVNNNILIIGVKVNKFNNWGFL